MNRATELLKNTVLLTISKIATQAISFLLVPLYTFYLSASDYGQVDLIMTYISLCAPIISVQLEFAAFRFAIDLRDDTRALSGVLSTIFGIVIPVMGVAIVGFAIVALFVEVPYAVLICLNVVASVVSAILLQFMRGVGDTKSFSLASLVIGALTTVLSFVFVAILHMPAFSLMISLVLANGVGIVYLVFAIKKKRHIHLWHGEKQASLRSDMLRYAIPLLPNNVAWWVLNVSDRTIISICIGAAANGVYAIANKFAFVPSILFGIFNMSWSESASLTIHSEDRDAYFSRVSDVCLRVYSFGTVIYLLVLDMFYPYIVGSEYSESRELVPILVIGAFFQAILGNYSAIYIAKKKTKDVASSSIAAAIINIMINIAFVGVIGVYAAAVSTAIAFASITAIRHFHVQRYVKIKYRSMSLISSGVILIVGCVTYYMTLPMYAVALVCLVLILMGVVLNRDFITVILALRGKKRYKNEG